MHFGTTLRLFASLFAGTALSHRAEPEFAVLFIRRLSLRIIGPAPRAPSRTAASLPAGTRAAHALLRAVARSRSALLRSDLSRQRSRRRAAPDMCRAWICGLHEPETSPPKQAQNPPHALHGRSSSCHEGTVGSCQSIPTGTFRQARDSSLISCAGSLLSTHRL